MNNILDFIVRGKTVCINPSCEKWVYGFLCVLRKFDNQKCIIPVDNYDGAGCPDDTVVVHPDSIGRYTGLKDKCGVKIFEGDILYIDTEDGEDDGERFEVSMSNFEWIAHSINFEYQFNILDANKIKVIGNIYDNKTGDENK